MKKALVVSALEVKSRHQPDYKTFERIYRSCVGPGYVLSDRELALVPVGSKLIMIDRENEKSAEAEILEFRKAGLAGNNQQRYDIYLGKPRMVDYGAFENVVLNRAGIAIIDED